MDSEATIPSAGQRRVGLLSWRRASILAVVAVYGPHVLMGGYTQFWVSCSHCRRAVWQLLPLSPGLLLYEMSRALLDFPRPAETVSNFAAVALSTLVLVGVAVGLRRAGRWWPAVFLPVLIAAGAAAVMLLGAIRS